jgi:ribosomal protein S18 acetylase RimI-like enzyme
MKFVIHENNVIWGTAWHIITTDGKGHIAASIEYDNNDMIFFSGLSVYEDSRNKGYGKSLIAEAESIGVKSCVKSFRLNVDKGREELLEYYKKLGYEVFDENDNEYELVKYNNTVY